MPTHAAKERLSLQRLRGLEVSLCTRYENTEARSKKLEDIGIIYMGM